MCMLYRTGTDTNQEFIARLANSNVYAAGGEAELRPKLLQQLIAATQMEDLQKGRHFG